MCVCVPEKIRKDKALGLVRPPVLYCQGREACAKQRRKGQAMSPDGRPLGLRTIALTLKSFAVCKVLDVPFFFGDF